MMSDINNYFNLYPLLHQCHMSTCMHSNILVCMVLTKQIGKIQRFISEQGAFPFVIVPV